MGLETLSYLAVIGSAGYGAYAANEAAKKKPKTINVSPAPIKANDMQAINARDDALRRMAKLRRATVTAELSNPNIKRKQLGAGT